MPAASSRVAGLPKMRPSRATVVFRRQHRRMGQVPLHHALPPGFRLGARHALDVGVRRLARQRLLVDLDGRIRPLADSSR